MTEAGGFPLVFYTLKGGSSVQTPEEAAVDGPLPQS